MKFFEIYQLRKEEAVIFLLNIFFLVGIIIVVISINSFVFSLCFFQMIISNYVCFKMLLLENIHRKYMRYDFFSNSFFVNNLNSIENICKFER